VNKAANTGSNTSWEGVHDFPSQTVIWRGVYTCFAASGSFDISAPKDLAIRGGDEFMWGTTEFNFVGYVKFHVARRQADDGSRDRSHQMTRWECGKRIETIPEKPQAQARARC
jgi:hypothetical protein